LDDDFKITKDRLIFGINGTFFNMDKGYRIPKAQQAIMPMYDPKVPGKLQLFISNYLLESFTYAFLEKVPFNYRLTAASVIGQNPVAPFETNTFEAVFPFLTSRFGKKIPTDLDIKVRRIWDVNCTEDERSDIH